MVRSVKLEVLVDAIGDFGEEVSEGVELAVLEASLEPEPEILVCCAVSLRAFRLSSAALVSLRVGAAAPGIGATLPVSWWISSLST